ncbi:MAG: DUF2164 domain-containing protein [Gemmatimonadetes bacterium]|nr:DUF2164 domain-containing protein [Gemmatimonadota bacterium]
MTLQLSPDARTKALASIRRYFAEELEHELGELPAHLFLDFLLEEIGPSVYNAAVVDAQTYIRDRVVELEDALHAPEFPHWQRGPTRGATRRPAR